MIIPAIDIIGGQCVRLRQGDYTQQTTYYTDPIEAALKFEAAGYQRLHIVDLDGAKAQEPQNIEVLKRISSSTSLKAEYGGGIKTYDAAKRVLESGAERVICGSIAISNQELFRQLLADFGNEHIVLGADCRDGLIATHGWLEQSAVKVEELIRQYSEIKHIIVTDIARDGMLTGPNTELYKQLKAAFPEKSIIASGGISSQADIEALHKAGIEDMIVGKALYEGTI